MRVGALRACAAAAALLAALAALPAAGSATEQTEFARNGGIAFVRKSNFYAEGFLYLANPASRKVRRLLKSGWIRDAAWSPDGKRLAVVDKCAIKVMPGAGGLLRTIVRPRTWRDSVGKRWSECYSDLDWSPDGRRLVFMRCGGQLCPGAGGALYVADASGRGLRQLTQLEFVSGRIWSSPNLQDSGPDWSSDGKVILFSRLDISLADPLNGNWANHARLYRLELDGGKLGTLPPRFAWSPRWSPDGTRIAFKRTVWHKPPPGATQTHSIVVANVDGSGERTLIQVDSREERCSGGGYWGFAWSPDGTKLAVSGPCPAGVLVMDADGSNRVRLTRGVDRVVAWRPLR